jgi:hypothetical protein
MGTKRIVGAALALVLLLGPSMAAVGRAQTATQAQTAPEPSTGAEVAAGFANIFYPPGKLILCTVGVGVGLAITLVTFGTKADEGARFVKGTCGGKWYMTAEQMERTVGDPPAK